MSDDSNNESGKPHRGYDFESGMFNRVREWTDLLPWVRLGRLLRVAISPPLLGCVLLTCLIHQLLANWDIVFELPDTSRTFYWDGWNSVFGNLWSRDFDEVTGWEIATRSSLKQLPWYTAVSQIVMAIVLWSPVALVLIRQGALLTAGRTLSPLGISAPLCFKRLPQSWLTALVPMVCVTMIGAAILCIGWIAGKLPSADWIQWIISIPIALLAIPCGILGFGQIVAVPLGWAATVCEKDPDPLDSLSRGYEYLYRRPIQLIFYIAVSVFIFWVVHLMSTWVAGAAAAVADAVLSIALPTPDDGETHAIVSSVSGLLRLLPLAATLAVALSSIGGIYLLLRRDAGKQEVEDIWRPSPKPKSELPELPKGSST